MPRAAKTSWPRNVLKSLSLLTPGLCRSASPRCACQGVPGEMNFAWSLTVHFQGFVTLGWHEQTVQRSGRSARSASLFLFCPLTAALPASRLTPSGCCRSAWRCQSVCTLCCRSLPWLTWAVSRELLWTSRVAKFSLLRHPGGDGVCRSTWVQTTWVLPPFWPTSVVACSCFLPVTRTW